MSTTWKAPKKSPTPEMLLNKKIDEYLADPSGVMKLIKMKTDHINQQVSDGKNAFFFNFGAPSALLEYLTTNNLVKIELTSLTWREFDNLTVSADIQYTPANKKVIEDAKKLPGGIIAVFVTSYGIHSVSVFRAPS